ncbi:hypothetical protein MAPG_09496 [Magnaporthiopsis poae ATCC 64411]|uniref:F-box domain-containing protein n=1 Tax=Magnaporthiopsis poae (strain ATCC 64411 / 73-15) TaxID=644358 RepID=A0A0C4EA40_MAGP6|nr:hypothetical protein MAPG_09496 [Magnaporthiopsis poae ATCC 64411]
MSSPASLCPPALPRSGHGEGGRARLPQLPDEIWRLIAEHLGYPLLAGDYQSVMDVDVYIHLAAESTRDLRSLCLTSRGWHAIASRVLYRDITLSSRFAAVRLSETLRIKEPQLAGLVRSLTVGFVFDPRDRNFDEREHTFRPHFINEAVATTAAVEAMRAVPDYRMASRVPAVLTLLLPHLETLTILPPDSRFTNENEWHNYVYYLRIMTDSLEEAETTLPARTLRLRPGASWLCPWGYPHRERDRVPLRLITEAVHIPDVSTLEIQRDEGPYHVPHPAWTRGATRLNDSFLDNVLVGKVMRQATKDPQAKSFYTSTALRDLRLLESSVSSFDLRALFRLVPNLQSFAFSRPRMNELDSLARYFLMTTSSHDSGAPLKQPLFRDTSHELLALLVWRDSRDINWFTDPDIHIDAPGVQPDDDNDAALEPEPTKDWPSRGPLASRRRMLNGLSTLCGVRRLTVRLELLHEAGTELKDTPIEALLPPTVEELRIIEPIAAVYVKLLSLDSAVFNEAGWTPLPRPSGYYEDDDDNNYQPPPLDSDTALVLAHALEKHERYDEDNLTSTDIFAHDGPADGEWADWALATVDLSECLPLAPPLEGYLPDLHGCLSRLMSPQSPLRRVVLVLTQEQHVESFKPGSAHPYVLRPEVLAMMEDLRLRSADKGVAFEYALFRDIERGGPGAAW